MSDWIDITRPLTPGMIHWPGDNAFQLIPVCHITGLNTCNLTEIRTSAHIGTHLDAPRHYVAGGTDIAGIAVERLCGPATVVHFMEERNLRAADLEKTDMPVGDRVLLRTANERLWGKNEFSKDYYIITADAARWLVDHGTPLVGIDYLSVDSYNTRDHVAHYTLLEAGVLIVEGVDLSHVTPGRYELVALPLKIHGGDGSPIRAMVRPWYG